MPSSATRPAPLRRCSSRGPDPRAGARRHPIVPPADLLQALTFAADRHRNQRRKDVEASPYINHPIAVATVLAVDGQVTDRVLLVGAILHDTLEDTETSAAELETQFGAEVARLVEEVTDDKRLPAPERKRLQVERAPHASAAAKQLKVADKICNVRDVTLAPPARWSRERRRAYLEWTAQVVAGCRGVNPALERVYDEALALGRRRLEGEGPPI